jgi:hypothetical protein
VTIGLVPVALAANLSSLTAGSLKREPGAVPDVLPAWEILATVQSIGLALASEPLQRGPYYVLHAYDLRGNEVRLIAGLQLGDILSVVPALNSTYVPQYEYGPRMIHVSRRERQPSRDDGTPPRNVTPKSEGPGGPPALKTPRRDKLYAPPSLADGPTRVRPTPRFNTKADGAAINSAPAAPPHGDYARTKSLNESAPEVRGARVAIGAVMLGRGFGLDRLRLGIAVANRDLARLLGLGDFAHEIDVQQSVFEGGSLDLDVVGKLEDALKSARGDALIEQFAVLLFLDLLGALDRQRVFFRFDRKFVLAEAGNRDGDAVVVFSGAFDVVGRVAGGGFKPVQHGEQPVKADGGTIKGSKIKRTHGISSLS